MLYIYIYIYTYIHICIYIYIYTHWGCAACVATRTALVALLQDGACPEPRLEAIISSSILL